LIHDAHTCICMRVIGTLQCHKLYELETLAIANEEEPTLSAAAVRCHGLSSSRHPLIKTKSGESSTAILKTV